MTIDIETMWWLIAGYNAGNLLLRGFAPKCHARHVFVGQLRGTIAVGIALTVLAYLRS